MDVLRTTTSYYCDNELKRLAAGWSYIKQIRQVSESVIEREWSGTAGGSEWVLELSAQIKCKAQSGVTSERKSGMKGVCFVPRRP